MNTTRGLGPRGEGDAASGADRYTTWDAAYLLGSLTPDDRLEFEAHLQECASCRQGVTELSAMPALLAKLDGATVSAMDAAEPLAKPPNLLPSLLFTVRRRRRRQRVTMWTLGAAASVVVAIGVLAGVTGHSRMTAPSQASASARPMTQVGTKALASTVALSSQIWGTSIDLQCVCLAPVYAHHDKLAMVVVGRDGSHTQLATWVADPGHTANTAGSISTPVDQIAAVQVVSANNGTVLLQRSL